ncbi:Lactonase, 7-bladed beta-propeller-domain-containing protein [Naematelia encephala]|uniref:Lactonase, 7-bladed beta-propeller-domain-containing protein n=1 Tax=Naematelia encephala TaxID=71784 RepID=A0A1Y2AKU4_9TREE|nr:Lactonase, 7-bladed beta-propeller-domain-containing protein [Naematelia encephala]
MNPTRLRLLTLVGILGLAYLIFRPRNRGDVVHSLLVSTPSNTSFPFHILTLPDLVPTPLPRTSAVQGTFFPSHIATVNRKRREFLVTNERKDGEVWAVKLSSGIDLVDSVRSGGDEPAHCTTSRSGLHLICANYGSPSVSVSTINPLRHVYTFTIPKHGKSISHPHQIVQHPVLDDVYYVPDLGMNVILVLKLEGSNENPRFSALQRQEISENSAVGARHLAVTPDGKTLFLGAQTSSNVLPFSLHQDGRINSIYHTASLSSLPLHLEASETFALSDVQLHTQELFVLNRRVRPPYIGAGDTMAIIDVSDPDSLSVTQYVELGCWQTREMFHWSDVAGPSLAVTCQGADGNGAGVVLLRKVAGGWAVVNSWDSGRAGAMGIAGLS